MLIGVTSRSTVRKAARLAVYEDTRIRQKNHQQAPTSRPEIDLRIDTHTGLASGGGGDARRRHRDADTEMKTETGDRDRHRDRR